MLDVHPAHHAASTWRDFFVHIATIVIGLQIVGRDKQDFSVLQLAHAFEKASNFGRRRPNIAL